MHELAGKFVTVTNLDLPVRTLYRLAAPSTPAEVIDAVAEGSARGETFTHQQAVRPSPTCEYA